VASLRHDDLAIRFTPSSTVFPVAAAKSAMTFSILRRVARSISIFVSNTLGGGSQNKRIKIIVDGKAVCGSVFSDMKHLLLRDYQGQAVNGWLMSEKLDGWRAFWDGSDFITREGNVLDAPEWFKDGMPAMMLDGEIFAGRGEFNQIQTLMAGDWRGLSFRVFDAPEVVAPFRARLKFLSGVSLPSHASLVPHVRCRDTQHMVEVADAVVIAGGEGVVVRDPRAMYEQGRTTAALRWVPQCPRLNRRKSA
jgi:ATP-dependent DNA ligase